MGFAQKNAKKFFDLIKKNSIQLVVDIRLNNKSQLAGFTKGEDLVFIFLLLIKFVIDDFS